MTSASTYKQWFEQNIAEQIPDGVGWEWNESKVDIIILDELPEIEISRSVDFFTTIKAPHLKKGNVAKLYKAGHTSISSIILLTEAELVSVLGENGKKVFLGTRNALTNIPLYTLMGAWPMFSRGIGVRKIKKLYDVFGLELLEIRETSRFISVEGFQEKSAQKVMDGMQGFLDFLISIDTFVSLKKETSITSTGNRYEGHKICMTGFRDTKLQQFIEDNGGTIQNSVNKSTTIVIAKDPDKNSGKIQKAKQCITTDVVSIEQFNERY